MQQIECDWTFAEMIAQNTSMIEVLTVLHEELGQTMVAMTTGTKDRADLQRWLTGTPVPRKAEAKLRFALTVWHFVHATENAGLARRIFASVNPLTYKAVVVDIRDGRFTQVYAHLTCVATDDLS